MKIPRMVKHLFPLVHLVIIRHTTVDTVRRPWWLTVDVVRDPLMVPSEDPARFNGRKCRQENHLVGSVRISSNHGRQTQGYYETRVVTSHSQGRGVTTNE